MAEPFVTPDQLAGFSKADLVRHHALVSFNIYGIHFEVINAAGENGAALLADIQKEWRYFSSTPGADDPAITMTLFPHDALTPPRLWPVRTKLCQLAWKNGRRWAKYPDGTFMALRDLKGRRLIEVGLRSPNAVAELENLLHSSIGEQLERVGFVRLHALGYLTPGNKAVVHIAKGGAGKSTLASKILATTSQEVFGDETILMRKDSLYAYPVRIALAAGGTPPDRVFMGAKKILAEIPTARIATPTKESPRLVFHTSRKTPWLQKLDAFISIGLGLGLPQMKEYMIRPAASLQLLRFLGQRLKFVGSSRLEFRDKDIRENI